MKKQANKCKIATIPIILYHKTLIVAIGDFDKDAIAEHIKDKECKKDFLKSVEKGDISAYDGLVVNIGYGNNVLWVQSLVNNPDDIGTLAHEAFHVTYDILKRVGIPLSNDSEEAYSYLIGYITECVGRVMQTKKKDTTK